MKVGVNYEQIYRRKYNKQKNKNKELSQNIQQLQREINELRELQKKNHEYLMETNIFYHWRWRMENLDRETLEL